MFKRSRISAHRVTQAAAGVLLLATFAQPAPTLATHLSTIKSIFQGGDVFVVPDGTEVLVVTVGEVSGKTVTEGDRVTLRVDEDVVLNGQVVIVKGTLAKGRIWSAEKSATVNKGGKLGIRIDLTTTVDGQTIGLRAAQGKEAINSSGAMSAAPFGSVGFLKKGKSDKIKDGTKIKAYIDEDKRVRIKGGVI